MVLDKQKAKIQPDESSLRRGNSNTQSQRGDSEALDKKAGGKSQKTGRIDNFWRHLCSCVSDQQVVSDRPLNRRERVRELSRDAAQLEREINKNLESIPLRGDSDDERVNNLKENLQQIKAVIDQAKERALDRKEPSPVWS